MKALQISNGFHEHNTKERIMNTAIQLFSKRGYDKVTMREIASAVGINPASIYYHFSSKKDLLTTIYAFYDRQQQELFPNVDDLLALAETAGFEQLLSVVDIHYSPPELDEMVNSIFSIAFREINTDSDSEKFIRKHIFDNINGLLKPMLTRMVELKKLEPFDIDTFLRIFNLVSLAGAALYFSPMRLNDDTWRACLMFLFNTILPKK